MLRSVQGPRPPVLLRRRINHADSPSLPHMTGLSFARFFVVFSVVIDPSMTGSVDASSQAVKPSRQWLTRRIPRGIRGPMTHMYESYVMSRLAAAPPASSLGRFCKRFRTGDPSSSSVRNRRNSHSEPFAERVDYSQMKRSLLWWSPSMIARKRWESRPSVPSFNSKISSVLSE